MPKRYVVGHGLDPITLSLARKAAATGSGSEDGSVPAVGVGGGNTSLLSLLSSFAQVTQTAVAATNTASATAASDTDTSYPSMSSTASATFPAAAASVASSSG